MHLLNRIIEPSIIYTIIKCKKKNQMKILSIYKNNIEII